MTAAGKLSDTLAHRKFTVIEDGAFGRVSPTAFAVYAVICRHANYKTRDNSFPSHRTIAAEAQCSRMSVRRAIEVLVAERLISVKKTGRKGELHNHYTILTAPAPAEKGGRVLYEPGTGSYMNPDRVLYEHLTRNLELDPKEQEKSLPLAAEGRNRASSKNQPRSDLRYSEFQETLGRFWKAFNPKLELNFNDGQQKKALSEFLKRWPDTTIKQFPLLVDQLQEQRRLHQKQNPAPVPSRAQQVR